MIKDSLVIDFGDKTEENECEFKLKIEIKDNPCKSEAQVKIRVLGKDIEYLTKNKYTFPAYYDHDNVILYGSKIESFPFNAVIGKDGKIEEIVEGELSYDSLVEKLIK